MHFLTISSVLHFSHFRQSFGLNTFLDGSSVLCHLPGNVLFLMFSTPLCMHHTRSSAAFTSCVRGPVKPRSSITVEGVLISSRVFNNNPIHQQRWTSSDFKSLLLHGRASKCLFFFSACVFLTPPEIKACSWKAISELRIV